jgi:Helix-turn-helix domain
LEDEHEASLKDAERGLSHGRAVSGECIVSARIIRPDKVFGRDRSGRRRSVPIELKLTFSLEEAAALSGLTETFLLKAIRNGELKASDKRSEGWNIKRWDLEDFVRGLS